MAFKPDPPGTASASWHAAIHNNVYPLIPLSALVAGVCLAIGLGAEDRWRDQARLAAAFAGIGAIRIFSEAVGRPGGRLLCVTSRRDERAERPCNPTLYDLLMVGHWLRPKPSEEVRLVCRSLLELRQRPAQGSDLVAP